MIHWKRVEDGEHVVQLDLPESLRQELISRLSVADRHEVRRGEAAHFYVPDEALDAMRQALRVLAGRDGIDPVEHVDVRLALDALPGIKHTGQGGPVLPDLELRFADRVVLRANPTWKIPHAGIGVEVPGHGDPYAPAGILVTSDGRGLTWEPGTTVLLRDVPTTLLPNADGPGPAAHTVVGGSDRDPHDALRRAAAHELGLPYHGDIPPAPADAITMRRPDKFNMVYAVLDRIRTDLPGGTGWAHAEVDLDLDTDLIHVHRVGLGGYYSEYALPLTEHRRALLDRLDAAFDRAPASYAVSGCDTDAAALLADAGISAFRIFELLDIVRIADADDARAWLAWSEADWRLHGWDVAPFGYPRIRYARPGGHRLPVRPELGWRASEAAELAGHGIGAADAYGARRKGLTTVEQVLAELAEPAVDGHEALRRAARWRPVAARAAGLLDHAADAVDSALAARLSRAGSHVKDEVFHDHDPQGTRSGSGVRVTRHDFTVPVDATGNATVSLWEVDSYQWWAGDDADVDSDRTVWTTEASALSRARADRADQLGPCSDRHVTNTHPGDRSCPPDTPHHCDNCADPIPDGHGMIASMGLACGVDCYDAMADAPGHHARRHHR